MSFMKHVNVSIQGKVQGVWFRKSAKQEADKRSIVGFVRNEPGGGVYLEAEGEPDMIDEYLQWCHTGPNNAKVSSVNVSEGPLKQFNDFKIIF